jgi:hypothetical protein
MLQERTPSRGLHVQPRAPQTGWSIFATALSVGLTVALAVLLAFGVRFWLKSDRPTTANAGPATPPSVAPSAAASPTPAPGEPIRPGQLANGVQLWAGLPLGNIHQDQGSTIPLPGGRTLWIFADTFQLYNTPKFFVTSSAAVTERNSWQLHYSTAKGIPTEFLPRTPAERADQKSGDHYQAVWPTGSTTLPDGRIIISYDKYRVLVKEKDFQYLGAGLFEYRYQSPKHLTNGGHATRIASDIWTSNDGEMRSPVYADGYVYFQQCRDLACQSLRVAVDQLVHRDAYRWWTGSTWTDNRLLARDIVVGSGYPGGNASVVRLRSGDYAMADTEVGAVGTTGQIWVAPDPWGPWSPAARFEFPRCPAPGCYGLNIHPSQSTNDRLRISYSTNGIGPFVRVVDIPVWISPDSSAIMIR